MTVKSAPHPGPYIRDTFLTPRHLTVTATAQLIGLSRPATSNFLNGKAAASAKMAARMEKAFGISSEKILEMQVAYDNALTDTTAVVRDVRTYVPPFLTVKANEITAWFSNSIEARTQFAVLLRKLIYSTSDTIERIDFPGNDDAERPGPDGILKTLKGSPWVPEGLSLWEFGVTANAEKKAQDDLNKSIRSHEGDDLSCTTFVFVTPQRWSSKTAWAKQATNKTPFREVRVYDVSDLEQWMEQSIPAQAWFSNKTHRPTKGVKSLDLCWEEWANATIPTLSSALFDSIVSAHQATVESYLRDSDFRPLIIAADSAAEGLAFLSQALNTPSLTEFRDRTLVFEEPRVLKKLASGKPNFIAVTAKDAIQSEIAQLERRQHSIIVLHRNSSLVIDRTDIVLEPLDYEAFRAGLEDMGKDLDDIDHLALLTGRSLTILRRQLSNFPTIKTPSWAQNRETAKLLVPFILIGVWNTENMADCSLLAQIADKPIEDVEIAFNDLLAEEDSPVWSVDGKIQGVVSKIDALFAIKSVFTKSHLERFFRIAKSVLLQDASSQEKDVSIYSSFVRESICETLVLLSLHCKTLFGGRFSFPVNEHANELVRELLLPLSLESLRTQCRLLAFYAEATPQTLLSLIEDDLSSPSSVILALFQPSKDLSITYLPLTELCHSLEVLAWDPNLFCRVVRILSQIAGFEFQEHWGNTFITSLTAIFSPWMPQTAASDFQRKCEFQKLVKEYPEVGWRLCLEVIQNTQSCVGHFTQKPKLSGLSVTKAYSDNSQDFLRLTANCMLSLPSFSVERLIDLIKCMPCWPPEDQSRTWTLLQDWAHHGANDEEIAKVQEAIRNLIASRKRRNPRKTFTSSDGDALLNQAKLVCDNLTPKNAVNKHEWLFRHNWVEIYEENDDQCHDHQTHEKNIRQKRIAALKEIVETFGINGVLQLSEHGKAQQIIGELLASNVLLDRQLDELLLISLRADNAGSMEIIQGVLCTMTDEARQNLYTRLSAKTTPEELLTLLLHAPYGPWAWGKAEQLGEKHCRQYWSAVWPHYLPRATKDNNESIRRLLKAQRPKEAFLSMDFALEELPSDLLAQLMFSLSKDLNDGNGWNLDRDSVATAFRILSNSQNVPLETKALLEFAFLKYLPQTILGDKKSSLTNLERYIAENPQFFVQAVVWGFRRENGGKDPAKYQLSDNKQDQIDSAIILLQDLREIPGLDKTTQEEQYQQLSRWTKIVRDACRELDREDLADRILGKLFSHAPADQDGAWPCLPVRRVMEEIHTHGLFCGAWTGLYNRRGVFFREKGGVQESALANRYRLWETALEHGYPWLASLMGSLADAYENESKEQITRERVENRIRH